MDGRRQEITTPCGAEERLWGRLRRFFGLANGRAGDASRKPTADKDRLGRLGEKLALKYLRKQGYRRLACNYKVRGGEVDLIMRDRDTVVFVEVKTRRDESFTPSEQIINARKRHHLETAAKRYIAAHRLQDRPCRFDTVAVVIPEGGIHTLRHQQNAFRPAR
jgi:putative endonuclease